MEFQPLGNMRLREKDGVSYLTFPCYDDLDFVTNAFSTKKGGVSTGEFSTMNLGFHRGDPERNCVGKLSSLLQCNWCFI